MAIIISQIKTTLDEPKDNAVAKALSLLRLSRAETEAVCRAAGQPWVTDETNDTDAYARNRLRHNALPALESTNA